MPEEIMQYIIGDALIIVPVLWIVGTFLKKTPNVPDWTIPWVLTACGVAASIAIMGVNVEAVLQGILVSGAAVLVHQLKVQTQHKEAS